MFETERMLLAEVPFIPLYSYVTKRLVDPRLRGWQNNVMDHHYSKDMFLLKLASEQALQPVVEEPEDQTAEQTDLLESQSQAPVSEEAETEIDDEDTEDPVE